MTVLIFSGAGLSAESGIPTFRDRGGIWEKYDPDIVCNMQTVFDPKYRQHVLDFYNTRQHLYTHCKPNYAHEQLAAFQKRHLDDVRFITQNVDSLLEDAGCQAVCHVHGDFESMTCKTCDHTWKIPRSKVFTLEDRCPRCRSDRVKPGVIFFGELAPKYWTLDSELRELGRKDILLVIGSAGEVITVDRLMQAHTKLAVSRLRVAA